MLSKTENLFGWVFDRQEKIMSKIILNIYPPLNCKFCSEVYGLERNLNFGHGLDKEVLQSLLNKRQQIYEQDIPFPLVDLINWYCYCCYDFAPSFPKLSREALQIIMDNHFEMMTEFDFDMEKLTPLHREQCYQANLGGLFGPLIYVDNLLRQTELVHSEEFYVHRVFTSLFF